MKKKQKEEIKNKKEKIKKKMWKSLLLSVVIYYNKF